MFGPRFIGPGQLTKKSKAKQAITNDVPLRAKNHVLGHPRVKKYGAPEIGSDATEDE